MAPGSFDILRVSGLAGTEVRLDPDQERLLRGRYVHLFQPPSRTSAHR